MYHYITKLEEFGNFIPDLQSNSEYYLDTETTGLDFFVDKIILLQVKLGDTVYIFDTRKLGERQTKYVVQLLKDCKLTAVGFNIKFDMKMLYTNYGELLTEVYDTMLAEILITNGIVKGKDRFYSLADLVEDYCGTKLNKEIRKDFFSNPNIEITEEHLLYAATDVTFLKTIKDYQLAKLANQKQLAILQLEMLTLPVICSMELEGVAIDQEKWRELGGDAAIVADRLRQELITEFVETFISKYSDRFSNALEMVDFLKLGIKTKRDRAPLEQITDASYISDFLIKTFNINSSDQMLIMLRDVYGIPIESTNEKIINKYLTQHPIIKRLLDYREQAKKVSSFGDNFIEAIHPVTGRIHTEFRQLGAQSGRIASSAPNLQNIPRDSVYRNAFIARPEHKILAVDFSQEELRLLAKFAGVKKMIDAYVQNLDLHAASAANVYGIPIEQVDKDQRQKAKSLNFAVGYGSTEWGLYKNFGIPIEEGRKLLDAFYTDAYPEIRQAQELVGKLIKKHGYSTTMTGRKRFFEEQKFFPGGSRERQKHDAAVVREGFNHIIQGTGADIIKKSLCRIYYENPFGDKLKILIQVYDEIVVEVSDDIAEQAKEFVENIMIETERQYLQDVVPAAVDGKLDKCWVH